VLVFEDMPNARVMILRRLAERVSQGVVLRRCLPHSFGKLPIYVTPEAGLGFWGRSTKFDPFLYRMASSLVRAGDSVWDVGANVGLFSFSAGFVAGREGSMLAVEPDEFLCGLLRRSHALNAEKLGKFAIVNAAASSQVGIVQFEPSQHSRAMSKIVSSSTPKARTIPAVTLDSLLEEFPPPSILKIDVEGHELQVLQGAKRVLAEARPTIWSEVSHENSRNVADLLHAAGYVTKSAKTGETTQSAYWDTLAVPA
jgi:FkbM family methyltransferase